MFLSVAVFSIGHGTFAFLQGINGPFYRPQSGSMVHIAITAQTKFVSAPVLILNGVDGGFVTFIAHGVRCKH